jgi:hypothetical protein
MGSDKALMPLKHLASTGATWVAIIVTQYQWTIDNTTTFPLYNASEVKIISSDYYTFVTLTDAEVRCSSSTVVAPSFASAHTHTALPQRTAKNMHFWSGEKYALLVRRKICTSGPVKNMHSWSGALPSLDTGAIAMLRSAQEAALVLPNVGMVVSPRLVSKKGRTVNPRVVL